MPRAVPEWSSDNPNARVPARVKLRIWRHQKGICGLSGTPIKPGDPKHLHHRLALILGGAHAESNLVWVHARLNAKEAKEEVAIRAKNDARAKAHIGVAGKPTQLSGRDRSQINADKATRAASRGANPPLPPRSLFVSSGDG